MKTGFLTEDVLDWLHREDDGLYSFSRLIVGTLLDLEDFLGDFDVGRYLMVCFGEREPEPVPQYIRDLFIDILESLAHVLLLRCEPAVGESLFRFAQTHARSRLPMVPTPFGTMEALSYHEAGWHTIGKILHVLPERWRDVTHKSASSRYLQTDAPTIEATDWEIEEARASLWKAGYRNWNRWRFFRGLDIELVRAPRARVRLLRWNRKWPERPALPRDQRGLSNESVDESGLSAAGHQPPDESPASRNGESPIPARDVAQRLRLPLKAVEMRLNRLRDKDPHCYVEIENPRPREPRYLYFWSRVCMALD